MPSKRKIRRDITPKKSRPLLPPTIPPDLEAKRLRVEACEREINRALTPIFARYRCRFGTHQDILDGAPGPVRIVVVAVE